MIRVIFTEEYRGVTEVVCNHVETSTFQFVTKLVPRTVKHIQVIHLHFTASRIWEIRPDLIKRIEAANHEN